MNEAGICTLWLKNVDGTLEKAAVGPAPVHESEERDVIILNIHTESVGMQLVFRRTDFAQMLAKPNEGDAFEVAVNIEEEA